MQNSDLLSDAACRSPLPSGERGQARLALAAVLACVFAWPVAAAAEKENRAKPEVKEEELQRVAVTACTCFPWSLVPVAPQKKVEANTDTVIDFANGDLIIKANGDFVREEKEERGPTGEMLKKEILTLTKNVEIEHLQAQSGLRGQRIQVKRDLKSGETELLEASGGVEVVTPERRGMGERLRYEIQTGKNGEVVKDLYTLEGGAGKKAVLFQKDDVIEAARFQNDRRLDTFRVSGGPVALVAIPDVNAKPGAPTPVPVAPSAQSTLMPGFNLAGGQIRVQADGEILYEGPSGRVKITRNVVIQSQGNGQVAMKLSADDAVLMLDQPPPGTPAANNSVFAGNLKSLECIGRVEIKTASQTILCDRVFLDMPKRRFVMEMKAPKDFVCIYMKDLDLGGKVMKAPKKLVINMDSGEIEASGPQKLESYEGAVPSNRVEKEKEPEKAKDAGKK